MRVVTICGRLLSEGSDYLRAATIRGQCIYSFGKPTDINDGWISTSKCSNDCQQFEQPFSPAVNRGNGSCITNSPSASLVAHVCSVYTSRSYYLRMVFISLRASNCTATIQGLCDYSKKYGMKGMYMYTISKLSIYSGFSDLCNSRVKSLKP